jgi:hypothetical protein
VRRRTSSEGASSGSAWPDFLRSASLVHRHDDTEVEGRGHDEEVDDGGDEKARLDRRRPDVECADFVEAGLAEDGGDEPQEDSVSERVDDRLEGGADDDADGQIDDIAAHDEFLKTVKHGLIFLTCA